MAKPELGLKRLCVACGTRFYDLMRAPAVCPKCGTEQPAEQPRSRRPSGGALAESRSRKVAPVAEPAMEEADAEVAAETEEEDEEVLEDTSDLEDGDADLASDIAVDEPGEDEER
jgi:uncharacterized protein (TIGR02300 family)